MHQQLYWPYDEVTVDWREEQSQLFIKAPWLQADLPVAPVNAPVAAQLARRFQDGSLSGTDVNLVSEVFRSLRFLPFCYTLPTPRADDPNEPCDHHSLQDRNLLARMPTELLRATLQAAVADAPVTDKAAAAAWFDSLDRADWQWDVEAALQFASLGEAIHPESLFTVIRRFHLLEVMEGDQGAAVFRRIEALPADDYRRIACLLVRQNHFVTEQCQRSLAPALGIAGLARDEVAAFMAEENGHDLMLGAALKTMVDDPSRLPVAMATRVLMHLLQYAAGRNLLAFAMAVDMFERSTYETTDPLARLLAKGGFDKAARQINRHKEINDAGAHENVAASFLSHMAPCDPDFAREAIRIAELISVVSSQVTASVWSIFDASHPTP